MTNRRVLFVDDEAHVVEGIKRQLRKSFEVSTCTIPREALELVRREDAFAVVVSDMRMPQMSGVEFLSAVKECKPDSVRIMLTGNQDQLTASAAVNQGEVFRFLNKPCDGSALSNVLELGVRQYQLVTAERDLLNRTLQGSIKVLLDALSIAKPDFFGSIDRIERRCSQLAAGLSGIDAWEMSAAARLSRLGCIGMSDDSLECVLAGSSITAYESVEYESHPKVGARLVADIPRLERVADCILYQHKNFDGSGFPQDELSGNDIPLGARVLRLVLAYDDLQSRGYSHAQALNRIAGELGCFDPALVDRLSRLDMKSNARCFRISPDQLHSDHTLAEDVESTTGMLLVCRGQAATPAIQRHLLQFYKSGALSGDILVQV